MRQKTRTTQINHFKNKYMKQLLIALLLTSTAYGQTNCTTVTKTTTGITIKNKGTYPAKYRIERTGAGDSVTVQVLVGASLPIAIAWCDSLYVTAIPTNKCSCTLERIGIYNKCGVLASIMDVKASRQGNVITYELTPFSEAVNTFTINWDYNGKKGSFDVSSVGHPVGKSFLYTFKLPE